jgi:hypothetical protein
MPPETTVLYALVVVVNLLEHGENFAPECLGVFVLNNRRSLIGHQARELDAEVPDTAQKSIRTFNASVVPLQCGFRRRGEHGVKTRGVGAVLADQVLRIDAVVLALAHGAHAFVGDERAGGQRALGFFELGADDFAAGVMQVFDLLRPEILHAAFV